MVRHSGTKVMSGLRRFFVDNISAEVVIEGEEFIHAVNVLRIKVDDEVLLCDNSGVEYHSKVKKINKKNCVIEVLSKENSKTEAKTEVILIAGFLKGDKTELIIQKAVELGVKEIVVFTSQYSSAYINENKLARLNKVSIESAKQCGRSIAPKVSYAKTFKEALEYGKNYTNKLFACEFATESEVNFKALNGSTAIVIGSEGGFSVEESDYAKEQNYKTVYLGKRILRAETAAIVLTGIVMHSLGELE